MEELGKIVMDQHAQRMHSYIHALEEEKRKIQVFPRELPLCLDLVNKAIENYRQQLSGTTTEYVLGGQYECLEQTSTKGPVLEEFIPVKRPCPGSDYDDEETEQDSRQKRSEVNGGQVVAAASDDKRKSDWLRSAQLWNQTSSDPLQEDDPPPKRVPALEVKQNDGAEVNGRKEDREPAQPHHKQCQTGRRSSTSGSFRPLSSLAVPTAATPMQRHEVSSSDDSSCIKARGIPV